MKKVIGALLLLVAVVGASLWFYSTVETSAQDGTDAMAAIPSDAALVAVSGSATDIWRDLSQSSVIWDELQATDLYFRLNAVGSALDSALRKEAEMRSFFSNRPAVVSVHSSGTRSYSYLLAIPLRGQSDMEVLYSQLLKLLRSQSPPISKTYDGVKVTTVQPSFSDVPVTFFVHERILVVSLSQILAEEAVRALNQDASVMADSEFVRVRNTTDPKSRARIFVNHQRFMHLLGRYARKPSAYPGLFESPYASWSAFDLTMKSNSLILNGFVLASDSANHLLSIFGEKQAPKVRIFGHMPVNTAFFTYHGYGSFSDFYNRLSGLRESKGVAYKTANALKPLGEQCQCDAEALATRWFGSQSAAFIVEPNDTDYSNNHFMAVHTANRDDADAALEQLQLAFAKEGEDVTEEFGDYLIRRLRVGKLYGVLLGEPYSGLDNPYVARIDDVVLFANSMNALRTVIQQIDGGKVLAEDRSFKEFSEQLSSSAHFMVYSGISRSSHLYQYLLAAEHAQSISDVNETLQKFQAFAYQVSHYKNDLFYSNIYFKHNPVYEQETASIWEATMRAPAEGHLHLVKNHYTGALEVLVQDENHRLGLYAGTGKLLWEIQLDGPIIGGVAQVDIYKNRKLQMCFSTESKLYLLDRNGNSVERFPLTLPAKALASVTAVDYDNTRDYRFFIPLTDGRIVVYESSGKRVEGWSFRDSQAPVVSPVTHIRVRGKDYLFAVNASGKVHLLDRKGNTRHQTDGILPPGYVLPGTVEYPDQVISAGAVYVMDTLGISYRVGFDGRTQRLDMGVKKPAHYLHADLEGDGSISFLYATDKALMAFNKEGSTRFETKLEEPLDAIAVVQIPGSKNLITAVNRSSGRAYVFDSGGKMLDGFPLVGHTLPAIGDLNNDGGYKMVTATDDGYLYGYSLSHSKAGSP